MKKFIFGVLVGAAAGIGGTYIYMQRKMADTITDAVDQIKAHYESERVNIKSEDYDPPVEDRSEAVHEKSCDSDVKFTQDNYKDYTKCRPVPFRVDTEIHENEDGEIESETTVKMGEEENLDPYSIPPEEFDSDNGYKKIMLTWYEKNKVLAYDNNPRITIDPDNYTTTVGDFENHFNDWERDTVYMRNEIEEIDYEIDACTTNYDEMIKVLPWQETEEDGPIDG